MTDIEERMAEVVKDVRNIKEEITDIKVTNAVIMTKLDTVIEQNIKQDERELIRDAEQKKRDEEQDKAINTKADKKDLDKVVSSLEIVKKDTFMNKYGSAIIWSLIMVIAWFVQEYVRSL